MSAFDHTEIETIAKWLGAGSINIFGRPFAGKDTQGNTLSDLLDAPLLGGGEILRNSIIPPRSREALKKGLLIPTDEYVEIVLPYLSQEKFQGRPLILSSVGRWSGEEASVMRVTEKSGHPTKAVFYLDVSEEVVRERWRKSQDEKSRGSRGDRNDDRAEVLDVRLREFREKTLPVITYYEQTGLFCRIDAEQPSAEVTAGILTSLLGRGKK
jgi:adenylate kinase